MLAMTDRELERKTLHDWRIERDMTVKELAALAGVAESTVWSAESSSHGPRLATLLRLTKALGILQDQIIWPSGSDQASRGKGVRRGPTRRHTPSEE